MRSRFYSTRQVDRRQWQKLQLQLEDGFGHTGEGEYDLIYNLDPDETLGPCWDNGNYERGYTSRCRKRGERWSKRWRLFFQRNRVKHLTKKYKYEGRCVCCYGFHGWDKHNHEE